MRKKLLGALILVIGSVIAAQAATPDQPYMTAALADLQKAKAELQAAMRNKGGHRGKAAVLVNQAIGEVKAGIAFAQRHNHHALLVAPDQPHMQAALDALNSAVNNLKQATPDKGGHRAKAISLANSAINEVQLGIQAGENSGQ
jgi:hypothetical protein